jgi:sterol desaturase/sphingolipid hydroxylase (fatty acid hydroxylase superfamily)
MPSVDLKFVALVFGIVFLVVLLARKAYKKVNQERIAHGRIAQPRKTVEKAKLTDEQFEKTWKSLSFLLLLAAAGSLYMVYNGVRSALTVQSGAVIFWIDAFFSLAAAIAAVFIWLTKKKVWVFIYFIFTIIPIFMLMSIKGQALKISALIHLFPLVLLYFVLKPVWENLEN